MPNTLEEVSHNIPSECQGR